MRDRVLTYALAVSVVVHILIFSVVAHTSAAKRDYTPEDRTIQIDVVKSPDDVKPEPVSTPEPTTVPKPEIPQPETPEPLPQQSYTPQMNQPKPAYTPSRTVQTRQPTIKSPIYSTKPTKAVSSKLPGNPGGALNMGSSSIRGQNLGKSGGTYVGWVPGSQAGTGAGSGDGPGVGKPDPVPDAHSGPGREASPPPPPPAPDVDVRVCAVSGMKPGQYCDHVVTKSFRPGSEPDRVCTECQPKHVNTLADRSVPELISGRKRPKYPDSARDEGAQGSVTIEYTIDTDGNVTGVKVTSSSGNSDLDRAAVSTVESRKYKPAIQGGIPRSYRKRETFHFALE